MLKLAEGLEELGDADVVPVEDSEDGVPGVVDVETEGLVDELAPPEGELERVLVVDSPAGGVLCVTWVPGGGTVPVPAGPVEAEPLGTG